MIRQDHSHYLFSGDFSMDEFYTIIMDLFLLQFVVPPFIDVSSMDTSYSLLMDLMDSRYGAFSFWALLFPGCDDLIIDPTPFGDIIYVQNLVAFQWMLHFM